MKRRNFFTLAFAMLGAVLTGRAASPTPTPTPTPTPAAPSHLHIVPDPSPESIGGHSHSIYDPGHHCLPYNPNWIPAEGPQFDLALERANFYRHTDGIYQYWDGNSWQQLPHE